MNTKQQFLIDAERVAFNLKHRNTIKFNMSKYDMAVEKGINRYKNLEEAKTKASDIKNYVIENLYSLLNQFENNCKKNGIHVLHAANAADAIRLIIPILKKYETKSLVKSKSMTTEEIHFNNEMEKIGIESVETDLGEYIVQLAGEPPYHIVTPAMHKSRQDVADLFHEKFGLSRDLSAVELTKYVRGVLRKKYTMAEAGITGANFLIADIGAIALTENEGNGLMSVSFPKAHIAIAGIEKIIPSIKDLGLFWPLLATHGTGQAITSYSTIISGPRKNSETDGPDEMYIILLDNQRSELYKNTEMRTALKCIRCGACLNACPVYKNIGGYTYSTTYTGPIGAVISPRLLNLKQYGHLSFASSLCGKCAQVCPVKINIPDLLLLNRRDYAKKYSTVTEKVTMRVFKQVALSAKTMNMSNKHLKNIVFRNISSLFWGKRRNFPVFKNRYKQN